MPAGASEIVKERWGEHDAIRIRDAKLEVVIVPELARVMHFGPRGGPNLLWTGSDEPPLLYGWKNWGGDKLWIAPQSAWPMLGGKRWPPPAALESGHRYEIGDRTVTTTSPPCGGVVARRVYEFKESELVIRQSLRNTAPEKREVSIWNVSQVPVPTAVYLPVSSQTEYPQGFEWLSPTRLPSVAHAEPGARRVRFECPPQVEYKVGADADRIWIAADLGEWLFVQRSSLDPRGRKFPDGTEGRAGFPVELYCGTKVDSPYIELELLSPLATLEQGEELHFEIRWSVRKPGDLPE